jgi:hypothetical protein
MDLLASRDALATVPEGSRRPDQRRPRHPELRPLLARDYVGFVEGSDPHRLVLPATAAVPLVLRLLDGEEREPAFLFGAHGSYITMPEACAPSYLEVWLAPLGAYTVLGVPMTEVSGYTVDLNSTFGIDARRLAEQVHDAVTWDERFALVDEFLLRRLDRGREPSAGVRWAWQRLTATAGAAPIGDLADEVGWSHKH